MQKEERSIVIIGKGTSVSRSTKVYVDSFDEVAICNQPPYEGFEHLISDHADYHFCNATGDLDTCSLDLGIKVVFNTGGVWTADRSPSDDVVPPSATYIPDCSKNLLPYFNQKYHFGLGKYDVPCAGTYAFETVLRSGRYSRIGTIGLDLMEVGKQVYYFPKEQTNKSLHYLWQNGTYTHDGIRIKESLHDHSKTLNYYTSVFEEYSDIEFVMMTDSSALKEVAQNFQNVKLL